MNEISKAKNKRNQKYYINDEKQERECGRCHEIKSFSSFPISDYGRPKSFCKPCVNKINKAWQAKQKEKAVK